MRGGCTLAVGFSLPALLFNWTALKNSHHQCDKEAKKRKGKERKGKKKS